MIPDHGLWEADRDGTDSFCDEFGNDEPSSGYGSRGSGVSLHIWDTTKFTLFS